MPELQAIDSVEIQVLIDNVTDSLSSTPATVEREWTVLQKKGLAVIAGDGLCCANHGLSLTISTRRGDRERCVLFDAGPADYAVERNGTRLGVNFGQIEAVILSHGHWDHAGGIPQALRFMRQMNGRKSVPLYLHPGMFQQRGTKQPDHTVLPMQRVPSPHEWTLLGAQPIVADESVLIADSTIFVSGEIPRVTPYEVGFPGHVCKNETTGSWDDDELIMDERFVAVHLSGKGLVVFSACSHAGIINVLTEVVRIFPSVPIYAIMGGLHLAGASFERVISETVRDLRNFRFRYIVPAHCTGWRAVHALVAEFGETMVLPCAVGKRFTL